MNPNLEKLQKLFALLKEETISPSQLKDMVAVMVAVVKKSREENQKVSEDLKATLNETLKYISKEHEKTLKNTEGLNEIKIKRLEKMVSDTLKTAQNALKEVKSIEVMDGADADSEEIIKEVLKKLPKVEKVVLDDRKKIVEKINSGGNEKINASEIKGLPEFTREVIHEVGSVGHIETPLKAGTNVTITTDSSGAKVISASGGSGSGIVETVVAGTGISVDNTDPVNPIVTNTNPTPYTLPVASTTVLGGVKQGTNISIDANGVISSTASGTGDVVGPAGATDNAIARYDTTTGKLIQNSTVTLADDGTIENINAIKLDTTPNTITPTNGQMYWDATDGTVAVNLDTTNGVTLQLGQEEYIRVVNKTGAQINDGQVVRVSGAQGNRPTAVLAQADAFSNSVVIGVATQNIAINAEGFVTTHGIVNGYDTSTFSAAGAYLYLDSVTPGKLTDNITTPVPAFITPVAVALNKTNNGAIFVSPFYPRSTDGTLTGNSNSYSPSEKAVKTYVDTGLSGKQPTGSYEVTTNKENTTIDTSTTKYPTVNLLKTGLDLKIDKTQNDLTKEPTGFTDPANVIINYDPTTQQVTLTGTVVAYYRGVNIAIANPTFTSGWVSPAHTNTTGHTYFLYYDGTNFLWADNTFPGFDMVLICYVNYDATNKFALRECHGFMPWEAHQEFHYTIGTYKSAGGTFPSASYTLNSTTAANRRPNVDQTTINDEDCPSVLPALTSKSYTLYNLTGASVGAYTLASGDIIPLLANNPYYNSFSTPNWGQTLMPSNSVASVWVYAIPVTASAGSQAYRYLFVQPQWVTLAAGPSAGQIATAVANESLRLPSELNLGTLGTVAPELLCIGRIIIDYTTNWRLQSVSVITGNKFSQIGSPSGNFLSTVVTDTTLSGSGTVASPLSALTALNTKLTLAGVTGGQTAIGGTGVTDILKLQGTSGNGTLTSPAIQALVGNNGATTALTVLNNGNVGIGTTTPTDLLEVSKNTDANVLGLARFFNRGASTAGRYTSIMLGKSEVAGGAGSLGFVSDTATPANAFMYLANYGDSETTASLVIKKGGNVGIGTTSPTAYLNIKAGTASAGTAPIKLTAGVVNTTPEAGTIEFDGTDFFISI